MRTGRESNHIKTTGVQDLCSLGLQLTTLNEFCYHQVLRVFIRLRALQLALQVGYVLMAGASRKSPEEETHKEKLGRA